MGDEPAASVWLWMMYSEALLSVIGCEPMVRTGAGFAVTTGWSSALVRSLIIIADAEGASEKVEPDMTIAEEPATNVWEPITMGDGLFAGVSSGIELPAEVSSVVGPTTGVSSGVTLPADVCS